MEPNKYSNSNADSTLFGTSSDNLITGLHNGEFAESSNEPIHDGDKELIVNEQEQNFIVNPAEEEFDEITQVKDPLPEKSKKEEVKPETEIQTPETEAPVKNVTEEEELPTKKNLPD